jgi:hypothetical protein
MLLFMIQKELLISSECNIMKFQHTCVNFDVAG